MRGMPRAPPVARHIFMCAALPLAGLSRIATAHSKLLIKRTIMHIVDPATASSPTVALALQQPPSPTPFKGPRHTDSNPLARWLSAAAHEQAQKAAALARERERLQQAAARYAAD